MWEQMIALGQSYSVTRSDGGGVFAGKYEGHFCLKNDIFLIFEKPDGAKIRIKEDCVDSIDDIIESLRIPASVPKAVLSPAPKAIASTSQIASASSQRTTAPAQQEAIKIEKPQFLVDSLWGMRQRYTPDGINPLRFEWPDFELIKSRIKLSGSKEDRTKWGNLHSAAQKSISDGDFSESNSNPDKIIRLLDQAKNLRESTGVSEIADFEAFLYTRLNRFDSAIKLLLGMNRLSKALAIWAHSHQSYTDLPEAIIKYLLVDEKRAISCLLTKFTETENTQWKELSHLLLDSGVPLHIITYAIFLVLQQKSSSISLDATKCKEKPSNDLLDFLISVAGSNNLLSNHYGYVYSLSSLGGRILDDRGIIVRINRATESNNKQFLPSKLEPPIAVKFSFSYINNVPYANQIEVLEHGSEGEITRFKSYTEKLEKVLPSSSLETKEALAVLKSLIFKQPTQPQSPQSVDLPAISKNQQLSKPHNLPRTANSAYNQAKTIHEEGNTHRRNGNESRAAECFKSAETLYLKAVAQGDLTSVTAAKDLVSLYQQMRRFSEALSFMLNHKQLLSSNIISYKNILHTIYLGLKDYAKCLEVAKELYEDKRTAALESQIGFYYSQLSDVDNAFDYWDRSVKNPSCVLSQKINVLQLMGLYYCRLNRLTEAEETLKRLRQLPNSITACERVQKAINDLSAGKSFEETIESNLIGMMSQLTSENDVESMEDESVYINEYEQQLLLQCDFDGIPGTEVEISENGVRYWKVQDEETRSRRIQGAMGSAGKGDLNYGTRSKRTLTVARCYKDWYDETKSSRHLVKYSQFFSESLFFRALKEISSPNVHRERDFACFLLRESVVFLSKSVNDVVGIRNFWEAVGCILSTRILGNGQVKYSKSISGSDYLYPILADSLIRKTSETVLELAWIDESLFDSGSHDKVRRIIITLLKKFVNTTSDEGSKNSLVELLGPIHQFDNGFGRFVSSHQEEHTNVVLYYRKISTDIESFWKNSEWIQANINKMLSFYGSNRLEILDQKRIKQTIQLLELLQKTSGGAEYDLQIEHCERGSDISAALSKAILDENEIEKSAPTLLSLQGILSFALRINVLFRKIMSDLYEKHEPDFNVSDVLSEEGTVISSVGEVFVKLAIRNGVACTTARDIYIEFAKTDDSDKFYSIDSEFLTMRVCDSLQQNSLTTFQLKANLTMLGRQADALQLYYKITYTTVHGDTKQFPKEAEREYDSLTIRLKSDSLFVAIQNPYQTGNPVRGSLFFGRESDIKDISGRILAGSPGQTYVIFGQMRTGKSSLLNAIEECISESGCLVVKAPAANGVENIHGYVKETLDELQRVLPSDLANCIEPSDVTNIWQHPSPLSVLSGVFSRLKEHPDFANTRIVLTCDEFQYVYSHIIKGTFPQNFMDIWKRWMQQISAFSAILVGNDAMDKFIKKSSNAFAGLEKNLRITYLDAASSEQLIATPIPWIDEDGMHKRRFIYNSIERIFQLTNGSAFHIQHICSQIVNRMNNDTHQNSITEDDVNAAIEKLFTVETYENLFHMLYISGEYELFPSESVSPEDNRIVLDALAQLRREKRPATKEEVINAIQMRNLNLSSPLDDIVRDLFDRGVLIALNGEYQIVLELYYEYMKRKEGFAL